MRTLLLAFLAALPLGCAVSTTETVYDIKTIVPEGGGGGGSTSSGPDTEQGEVDASVCVTQGSASLSGSLGGAAVAPQDAIEVFDATRARFEFLITDFASACASGGGPHAGSSVVSIGYEGNALRSGTYDLAKTQGLSASFTRYDASCQGTTEDAASGTVKFDRLDDCGGEGSFDLVLGADHVTGSFTASVCALPAGPPTCK